MINKNEKRIEITRNGPYLIYGNIPIDKVFILPDINYEKKKINSKWGNPKKIKTNGTYTLCRCGESKKPPFCDGSHIITNFEGKETAKNDKVMETSRKYLGKDLIMMDKKELCFGAGFCYSRHGNIWEFIESKDSKHNDTIIQMSKDCPAGRFVILEKKTKKIISPKFPQSISVVEETRKQVSGPLWVKGNIQIVSFEKGEYEKRDSISLCRCGESKNKPFCDGTHSIIRWNDDNKSLKNEK